MKSVSLIGNIVEGTQQQGSILFISDRWPFRAQICQFDDDGTCWATLSSGGFVVAHWERAATTPEALAEVVNQTSKLVFQQCSWYQQ